MNPFPPQAQVSTVVADPASVDGRAHGRFTHHICVAAPQRTSAGMEGVRHGLRPLHGDVARQEPVGAAHPGEGRSIDLRVEVHNLHQPMNTRIRTARAKGVDRFGSKLSQGALEPVLNRLARWLALPALVGRAEVTDAESNAHPGIVA